MSILDSLQNKFGKVRDKAEQFQTATKGIEDTTQAVGRGAEKASSGVHKFAFSLARVAKMRMMRMIIREIFSAFSEGLTAVKEFSAGLTGEGTRMADALGKMQTAAGTMKNQIGSAFGELLSLLQPIISTLIAWITKAMNYLSQFLALLGGNNNYYKAVDATEDMEKATVGGAKAAKEWRRQLMGFDVINRLDNPSNPSGGGGGGSANKANNAFEFTPVDKQIKDMLAAIELVAGTFLLALGLILFFTGANTLLGLGLIVAGAWMIGKSATENWSTVPPKVQKVLATIMTIASVALMAIGAVFLVTGNVGIGLGMILAGGAAAYGISAVFGRLNPEVQTQLRNLMAVASAALAALGVVFLLLGHFGIGLAMIIAGGAMGVTAAGISWDALLKKLKEVWKGICDWFDTNVKKYFTMEYWDNLVGDSITQSLENFGASLEPLFSPIVSWLDKIFAPRSAEYKVDMWMNQWIGGGVPMPQFATGGFPEDGLFMANHGELIGQFANGQTAVANNEQIIAGIERGVYNAMSSALAGNSGSQEVRVYLDGKQISNAVTKNQRQTSRATGVAMA